jgi:hypothetical protein
VLVGESGLARSGLVTLGLVISQWRGRVHDGLDWEADPRRWRAGFCDKCVASHDGAPSAVL